MTEKEKIKKLDRTFWAAVVRYFRFLNYSKQLASMSEDIEKTIHSYDTESYRGYRPQEKNGYNEIEDDAVQSLSNNRTAMEFMMMVTEVDFGDLFTKIIQEESLATAILGKPWNSERKVIAKIFEAIQTGNFDGSSVDCAKKEFLHLYNSCLAETS